MRKRFCGSGNGRMKIQVYPNSVLACDRELLGNCYDGDIPFVVQNTAPQVNFIPDTAVFDAPCAFDKLEDVRDAVRGCPGRNKGSSWKPGAQNPIPGKRPMNGFPRGSRRLKRAGRRFLHCLMNCISS